MQEGNPNFYTLKWPADPDLLGVMRTVFEYGPGENRATGYLYAEGERPWPPQLADLGPAMLGQLEQLTGVRYRIVAFQAYLDGAGCDWHTDDAFDEQAIVSLGVVRTMAFRRPDDESREWTVAMDPDWVMVMPSGFQLSWQHCIPRTDDLGDVGERVSLVFRTPRS